MKINFSSDQNKVGRVTPCAPPLASITDGAHGVTRPTLKSQRAFTMIEIAIALAVIAFALVAIIGVLPTGLNVQKDNREDTIVNQDGPYWLEAIRSGAKGLDALTNSVEKIGVVLLNLDTNNPVISTNFDQFNDLVSANLNSGSNIVGLLSMPKWSLYSYNGSPTQYVIRVEAEVRALTGSAVEQGTNNTGLAFSYLLVSEVVPFDLFQVNSTNWVQNSNNYVKYTNQYSSTDSTATTLLNQWVNSANRWAAVPSLHANTHESRLTFRWPLLGGGRTGPNRQLFRSIISGQLARDPVGNNFYYFQPQLYVKQ